MKEKKQVLFVDDDELVLSCYQRLLGRHFSVETALGAARALEVMKEVPFAVIAADLLMPEMNGIELLKSVKSEFPETVGLLLTGNVELDDADVSRSRGLIFRLLSKPCPTADLIAAVEAALEQHRINTRAGIQ